VPVVSRDRDRPITDEAYHDVNFYVGDDSVSISVHHCWVSALFESLEAAKSWADHDVESEQAYRELNKEFDVRNAPRELLLGVRKGS
jgi:hypothetical protein